MRVWMEACLMVILGTVGLVDSFGSLRLCGKELADGLALVCQGRGYNVAFNRDSGAYGKRGGRYKRGIVDECCKKGCSMKTLESYCSDSNTKTKDTLQISKRSEHTVSLDEASSTSALRYKLFGSTSADETLAPTGSPPSDLLRKLGRWSRIPGSWGNSNGLEESSKQMDTAEIMAEVVDMSGESTNHLRRKHSALQVGSRRRWEVGESPPYYLGRPLLLTTSH